MSLSCFRRKVMPVWLAGVLCLGSIASTPDDALLTRWDREGFGSNGLQRAQKQPLLAFSTAPSGLAGFNSARQRSSRPQPPLKLAQPRRDCSLLSTVYAKSETDQGVATTVEGSVKRKRRRGIGADLVVTPRSELPNVDTKKKDEKPGLSESAPVGKKTGRGKAEKDGELTSAFSAVDDSSEEQSVDEELEQEWKEQVRRQGSIRPAGASRPAGARVRSRIRTEDPREEGKLEGKQDLGLAIERHKDLELREMLRRTSIVTKGTNASASAALFVNPGFLDRRNTANERSAEMDSRAGSVSLLDLKRLGLVDPAISASQLRRGNDAVEREIHVGMAIFDMQVHNGLVFSAGSDDYITVWDVTTWEPIAKLEGHTAWVNALLIDEERNVLLSASDDGSVRAWDLETYECIREMPGHTKGALSLSIHRNQMFVGCEGKIVVWDVKKDLQQWEVKTKLLNHTHVLRAMSDGQQLSKNRPMAPRAEAAREPSKLFGHKVCGIQASGPYMLSAVDDGSVWVWNTKNMEVERKLLGPSQLNTWVRPLVIKELFDARRGNDRAKLVSGWADGAIRIYDVRTWKLEHTLRAHNGPILSLSQSDDGSFISTGADMAANIWDSESWTVTSSLRSHKGAVCAACEVNGKIVTASLDGLIKIWNI